jgi:hypothetical protein
MNPAVPLLTTILVTSLAAGHAAEPTQSRDRNIQIVTSRNHYVFKLAWIRALPRLRNK